MIEYASEDGSKERDRTPAEGKFWIYENAVQGLYYAIFVVATGELEVHRLVNGQYRKLQPDEHGHYLIEPLGVALGVWHGFHLNETAPWLRWYDLQGNLLPLDSERGGGQSPPGGGASPHEEERLRAEDQARIAEEQRRREDQARIAEEQRLRRGPAGRRGATPRRGQRSPNAALPAGIDPTSPRLISWA